MNVAIARSSDRVAAAAAATAAPARIALLGTGNVGRVVLARLGGTLLGERLSLVYVANTREAYLPSVVGSPVLASSLRGADCASESALVGQVGDNVHRASTHVPISGTQGLELATRQLGSRGTRILIDATASDEVAAQHAHWLAQGIHVVTACKLGQGTCLQRWRAIRAACLAGDTHYGDSATVGAGLPLLRSIRELQAGGDRIHAVAGALSGSLAWLFHRYDGRLPFSDFVREARDAGFTEPDPREDLSGEDVRRKLLILARAAGMELQANAVAVDSLVSARLAALARHEVDAGLPMLDAPLRKRFAEARKLDRKLHFIARLQQGHARVGLEALPSDDPLAGGAGTDNRLAIWSDRYHDQPLVVQGPGAGAEVTASALLDDVLRIVIQHP